MKKINKLMRAAFCAGLLLSLTACSPLISNTIHVINQSAGAANVHIEYGDNQSQTTSIQIIAGGGYYDFFVSFSNRDGFGEIRIIATQGTATWRSIGNIAENNWIIYVFFPADFTLQ